MTRPIQVMVLKLDKWRAHFRNPGSLDTSFLVELLRFNAETQWQGSFNGPKSAEGRNCAGLLIASHFLVESEARSMSVLRTTRCCVPIVQTLEVAYETINMAGYQLSCWIVSVKSASLEAVEFWNSSQTALQSNRHWTNVDKWIQMILWKTEGLCALHIRPFSCGPCWLSSVSDLAI